MFSDDSLLPISALQHLLFCERQAALIHVERMWAENRLTVEGRHLHRRAHGEGVGPRGGGLDRRRAKRVGPAGRAGPTTAPGAMCVGDAVRVARALPLRSLRLGLFGVADVVEYSAADEFGRPLSAPLPLPVEYKRGRPKQNDCDRVQVCAQALCLEEMLGVTIPRGALFYARTRDRLEVMLDAALRARTEQAAVRLHELIAVGRTPTAAYESKCRRCSLFHQCMPRTTGARRSATAYLRRALAESRSTEGGESDAWCADGGVP